MDALHIGDVEDGEFVVTLFQGKYQKDLAAKCELSTRRGCGKESSRPLDSFAIGGCDHYHQ